VARAQFTQTFELYFGPATITPGVLKATFAGRRVISDQVRVQNPPYLHEVGYVTTNHPSVSAAIFVVPVTDGIIRIGTEDQIACPALGLAPTPVLWYETVAGIAGTPYIRVHYGRWPSG
jgi:hypothetical protein